MPRSRFVPPAVPGAEGVPFDGAEQAWLWCVEAETYRLEGARMQPGLAARLRPCEPVDVLKAVERLRRGGAIRAEHVAALMEWGMRQERPDGLDPDSARALRLWREALDRLEPELAARGIVRPPPRERAHARA